MGKNMNNQLNQFNNNNNNLINNQQNNQNFNNNQVNNQNNNNIQPPYNFSRYTKASKTGLKNLGDTSYLNAVLQLFGTFRNLSSYFVNPKNKIYFDQHLQDVPLAFVFHRLFLHLYPYPEKYQSETYNPEVLLQILGQYNAVYNSKKSRNPNDLINFILIQMHRELNVNKTKYISKPDKTNKGQVLKQGMDDFVKSNKSIISNNFIWFEIKKELCPSCNSQYYEFNHFETLELDILSAYQKFQCPLTIYQTLTYQNQKNKKIYCQNEQAYKMVGVTSKIYASPNYFIFSLGRGNLDQNLMKIPFKVEQEIDISKILENQQSYKRFELIGIVSISKNEGNKYVCFGKSPADKKWYLYNDNIVNEINFDQVINANNNINQYIPCILAYQFKQ